MTREEAREILTHNWTRVDNPNYSESELDEAFFMAIEALSANATVAKIQIDDIDKAKTSSQLLDDLAVGMVRAMGKRIVEVVRCKDCRFAMIRTEDEMNKPIKPQPILCEWFCIGVENDDYCSHGERQET